MISGGMQQMPPSGSIKNGRKSGQLNLEARRTPVDKLSSSKLFSTGRHATLEGAEAERRERSGRILRDVRRALLFALVLVVVGAILVEFVKLL